MEGEGGAERSGSIYSFLNLLDNNFLSIKIYLKI
jgi:hypothetical protein